MSIKSFQLITASGTPYEIGLCHGREGAEKIKSSVDAYRVMFRDYAKLDWKDALEKAKTYIPFIEKYNADLMEEIQGVADGSGLPLPEIVALNARSELALTDKMLSGCTSFALTPEATGGKTYVGQNWDWKGSQRKALVVLKILQKNKPNIIMVTEAGIIGKIGFNDAGIGVCLNALVTEQNYPGTPLHIILREILNSEILADAVGAVARTKIASAANFLVCQKDGEALDIEALPSNFDVLFPDRGVLLHANHINSLRFAGVKDLGKYIIHESPVRQARAEKLFEGMRGNIGVQEIKTVLRDHFSRPKSICSHDDLRIDPAMRSETVFSIIMDLAAQSMYVTDGPPCESEYELIKAEF